MNNLAGNLAMSLVFSLTGLAALAQDTNNCTFGSYHEGINRFEFTPVPTKNGRYKEYNAVINEQLKVSVTKSQGYSAIYRLIVNYKDGEVLIQDSYADFAELRDLHVSAKFNGKGLSCVFTPGF